MKGKFTPDDGSGEIQVIGQQAVRMVPPHDSRPILCLDFDGVIHSYVSGWQGAHQTNDPPVPGAMRFILMAATCFQVNVFSSRSHQEGGIVAMRAYIISGIQAENVMDDAIVPLWVDQQIAFPTHKPPAKVTIDDRAVQFRGVWPKLTELQAFKPWKVSDGEPKPYMPTGMTPWWVVKRAADGFEANEYCGLTITGKTIFGATTVEALRASKPEKLQVVERHSNDPPDIVEYWL